LAWTRRAPKMHGVGWGVCLIAIYRALAREVVETFGAALAVLLLVLASARAVRLLAAIAEGDLPRGVLAPFLGYQLTAALAVLVPAALFVAALAACGRWYRDHEMVILAMAGVGPLRLAGVLAAVAAPITLLAAILSLWAAPWAEARGARLQHEVEQALRAAFFRPGEFREINDGAQVFYAGSVGPDGTLGDVFVQLEDDAGIARMLAARAEQRVEVGSGDDFLVLREGVRYDGTPGQAGFRAMRFGEYGVRIARPQVPARPGGREGRPTAELARADSARDAAELQWRLSLPLAAFTLALGALPLSRIAPRTARGGRLVLAALAFFLYYNLLSTAHSLTAGGLVPVFPGMWTVHALAWAALGWTLRPTRQPRRAAP
jgi:lipopolysaccharide export system permease protein